MARGIDIDVQLGKSLAKRGQARDQALRSEQWQDTEPQAVFAAATGDLLDRLGHRVHRGFDGGEQLFAVGIDHHRLRAPVEQRFADEILEGLDAAAERGRGQCQFAGGGLRRT